VFCASRKQNILEGAEEEWRWRTKFVASVCFAEWRSVGRSAERGEVSERARVVRVVCSEAGFRGARRGGGAGDGQTRELSLFLFVFWFVFVLSEGAED